MNNQSKHNPANIYEVKEIRSKSTVYLGVGAIQKIFDITKELKERNITKAIVVTGKNSYQKSGAWEPTQKALEQNGIEYTIYDGITPNPTVDQVDEATAVAKKK
jgi:alcohol dehydrogenase